MTAEPKPCARCLQPSFKHPARVLMWQKGPGQVRMVTSPEGKLIRILPGVEELVVCPAYVAPQEGSP